MATCFCTGACRDGRGCSVGGHRGHTVNEVLAMAREIERNYPEGTPMPTADPELCETHEFAGPDNVCWRCGAEPEIEEDRQAVERGARALARFLFPGYVVAREEMAHAVLDAAEGEEGWEDRLPTRRRALGRPPHPLMSDLANGLADALDDLHRYSVNDAPGYAGSPCEAKVRAALEAIGREVP